MQNEDIEIIDINDLVRTHYLETKDQYYYNEKRIKELEEEYNTLMINEDDFIEFLTDKNVIKYLNICTELDSLKRNRKNLYKRLNQLHQRICEHPAYFVLRDFYNDNNEQVYTCSCIECGKKLNKNVNEFNDEVIIYPKDINNSEEEYKKYEKEYSKMMKRVL